MADSFISEYFYQTTAASSSNPEFIEIALAPGVDPQDIVISFYDTNGNLETNVQGTSVVNGEVSLGSLVGVPDPDNPNWTIYTIESTAPTGQLLNGGNGNNNLEANYVTLTDTSTDPNTVVDGYGIGSNDTETLTGGEADGAIINSGGGTARGDVSVKYDYLGNRTDTGVEGTATTDDNAIVPCFVDGTLITTVGGQTAIETLSVGDLVKTADGRFEPIRWIGKKILSTRQLFKHPDLRPVRIQQGALGKGLPEQDLMVSPQHRMAVRSKISERMFGPIDVLVSAKRLLCFRGIDPVAECETFTYYHLLFDAHEVIFANGAPSESLLAGPQAMQGMPAEQREELKKLFPDLLCDDHTGQTEHRSDAHVLPESKKQNQLIARHLKNKQDLLV